MRSMSNGKIYISQTFINIKWRNGMASHLGVLIKRVKAIPYRLKKEPVFKSKLINLAEYLRYHTDFTDFERRKASALLKAHNLDYLLTILDEKEFEKEINRITLIEGKTARTCIRCGRTLTLKKSIKRGYGEECFEKVGIPLDEDLRVFMG